MSSVGPEEHRPDLAEAIRQDFASIMNLNLEIGRITASRDEILSAIRERIRNEDVPEELRFIAKELMSSSAQRSSPETIQSRIDYWESLDNQLRMHAGQTLAWLEPEEVIDSYRFPGPNKTDFEYYLNLGILPADAQLQNESSSSFKIPVEKAVRIRFFYNLDEKLAWDMGIGAMWHFVGEPEFLADPEILPTQDGLIPSRALGLPTAVRVPLPMIGNEAVAAILDTNNLADEPAVQRAAQMLTEIISE